MGDPAGNVVREGADEQPGGVGEEAAGGSVVESGALLEVADRELDLRVAAVVALYLRERLCAVGDEGVVAPVGEELRLSADESGAPDDESTRAQ